MPIDNAEVAAVLSRIAVFSELAGENPFKARAFANVARAIEKHPEKIEDLAAQGRLREIHGVGKSIEEVVADLLTSGRSRLLDELVGKFPAGIQDLLSISGMGPKRVKAVYENLGISRIGELEYACRENRLIALDGFGEKTQANILKAIEFRKRSQDSRLFSEALAIGEELVSLARESGLFEEARIAGSLRRGKSTFKDIDILLIPGTRTEIGRARDLLLSFADPQGIIGAGDTKVSIRRTGLQVDFRMVPAESRASALQHFTGSKEHNTLLRSRAKAMSLKMNEYGVFREDGTAVPCGDEEAVYRSIGLSWIPPEIREADGEIEAAEAGALPVLVEAADVRGMVHLHSTWSDGTRSVEEMARECRKRGFSWMCLSDHSRSAGYAGGLSAERLADQAEEVKAVNRKLSPFRVFHGVESDILSDGSLDYPDEVLARLDFVIGSVHSKLVMGREEATARLLKAVSHPLLTMLGHPGGRLLLAREGYPYDEAALLDALAVHGTVLEHNCNPHRLDPDWIFLRRAARRGIPISIDPDAHDLEGLDDLRYGLAMARKAWCAPAQLFNCRSAEEADAYFQKRRQTAAR
jgi:DNA polymerase (family X)